MTRTRTNFRILAMALGLSCAATSHAQDFANPDYGRIRPQFGQILAGRPTQEPQSNAVAQTPQEAAVQAATSTIEQTMLQQRGKWYVKFSIKSEAQPQPQLGGFAPVVVPNPAAPLIRQGLIEVVFSGPPSVFGLPHRIGEQVDWKGEVQMRLQRFRVYEPGKGWGPSRELLIHMWEWNAQIQEGQLTVTSATDAANNTTDGGVSEFVASVFNVPVTSVQCVKPQLREIPNTPSANQPAPNRPWRAQYNQVAPAFRRR